MAKYSYISKWMVLIELASTLLKTGTNYVSYNFQPFASVISHWKWDLARLEMQTNCLKGNSVKNTTNYMSTHYACHCIDLKMSIRQKN